MASKTDSITVDVQALRFLVNGANTPFSRTRVKDAPQGFKTAEYTVAGTETGIDLPVPPGSFKFLIITTTKAIGLKINGADPINIGSFLILPDTDLATLTLVGIGQDSTVQVWSAG